MYKTIVAAILAITTSTLFAAQAPPQTKKTQNTVKHAPVIIKSKDGKKEVITYVKKDKTDFTGLIKQNSRYFLQIQNGCDHRCTFCIIPYGRGNSRSVSTDKILDNVNEALQNNFKEIVLTGVDLTSWGKELLGEEYSLGFLVKKILNELVSTISRVMFNSFSFFLKFDSDLLSHHFCAS